MVETNAILIVRTLLNAGVERLFGVPGGGSNADLIEAAARVGLPFTLAHSETASAFMAGAQAEITGKPGACLATLGPGAASLMNGVAYAALDRVPLFVITDCSAAGAQHQALPQGEVFRPLVKFTVRPDPASLPAALQQALDAVRSGPVHLDLSAAVTAAPAMWGRIHPAPGFSPARACTQSLPTAHRPVLLLGLGARSPSIRDICARHRIPALVTYKAKGVIPDCHPWFGGVFTNGVLEQEILARSDLLIAVGLDPVEFLPRPWTFHEPVPVPEEHLEDALAALPPSEWTQSEVRSLAEAQRAAIRTAGDALQPHRVVELVAAAYPGARITVDAGAHMFPVMSLWPAEQPRGVLISNGLSTMGFALPAAIGAALLDRDKPVVAFTGDGGLLMCLAELRTAARESLPLRIIVFDDGTLSLIKIKQQQRGYRADGVSLGDIDWPAVAEGLGVHGLEADSEESLRRCLRSTAAEPGPVLIAAWIDPGGYPAMMRALRGEP